MWDNLLWLLEVAAIGVSLVVVAGVWWVVAQVLRARAKGRLLAGTHGVVADAPEFIGISAVCRDVDSVARIADLLDVEYVCYELVVVLDAHTQPDLFHDVLRQYHMIRMNYQPQEACSSMGVRGFYRSQARGFNRLILLDQMEIFSSVSPLAAVETATYDYILPIGGDRRLLPGAVDRLVQELAERPLELISMVRTAVGPPLRLYAREFVTRLGGFAPAAWRSLSRKEKIMLFEPLLFAHKTSRYSGGLSFFGMALVVCAAVFAGYCGWLAVTLLLLDGLLLWGLCRWLASLLAPAHPNSRNPTLGA